METSENDTHAYTKTYPVHTFLMMKKKKKKKSVEKKLHEKRKCLWMESLFIFFFFLNGCVYIFSMADSITVIIRRVVIDEENVCFFSSKNE